MPEPIYKLTVQDVEKLLLNQASAATLEVKSVKPITVITNIIMKRLITRVAAPL